MSQGSQRVPGAGKGEVNLYSHPQILGAVMFATVTLGLIMITYSISSEMCYEKANGLLEFLYIAGVPSIWVKLSWFIFAGTFICILNLLLALFYLFVNARTFENCQPILFVCMYELFALAVIAQMFTVASCMATAQRAGLCMLCVMLIAYLAPNWSGIVPTVGFTGAMLWFARILSLLIPSVSIQIGIAYLITSETLAWPTNFGNMFTSPLAGDQFYGVGEVFVHMGIQCVMFTVLSWYFDRVAPSKYGYKQPFYFPLLPSYWCGVSTNRVGESTNEAGVKQTADIEMIAPGDTRQIGVHIEDLCKVYGSKSAVDHLTVDFYAKEITALLGHNGAGKSTTMNILTGMIEPSTGTAFVHGQDIRHHLSDIRRSLGFCPQYDIVYPELSVEDHMVFYGRLKGIPPDEVAVYARDIFAQMKMSARSQQRRPAGKLSGGMRRKLSIAIAFLGHPSTVILDEPTSAIDPFSRRAIWDLILSQRKTSTILISTHYMQEADVLADRIAIINGGQLKAVGSSMYLKHRYGDGVYVRLAHQSPINAERILGTLSTACPANGISLTSSGTTETVFAVAPAVAASRDMVTLLRELETNSAQWKIASFGVTESTLEQVFFRVAADKEDDDQEHNLADADVATKIGYENNTGLILMLTQFTALITKRALLSKRSVVGFVFQIIMPLVFAAILYLLQNAIAAAGLDGDVQLENMWNTSFATPRTFYAGTDDNPYILSMLRYGMGTICVPSSELYNASACGVALGAQQWPAAVPVNDSLLPPCQCAVCSAASLGQPASALLDTSGMLDSNLFMRNVTAYLLTTNEQTFIGGVQVGQVRMLTVEAFRALINAVQSGGGSVEPEVALDDRSSSPIVTELQRTNGRVYNYMTGEWTNGSTSEDSQPMSVNVADTFRPQTSLNGTGDSIVFDANAGVLTNATVSTQPTTTNQPTKTSQPTTTIPPTTTDQPTTTNQPTTTSQPTTNTQSTTTSQPTTTIPPTTTGQPTTTNQPTTTGQPTTTSQRTTTNRPTTTPRPLQTSSINEIPSSLLNQLLSFTALFIGTTKPLYSITAGIVPGSGRSASAYTTNMQYMKADFVNSFNNILLRARLNTSGTTSTPTIYGLALYTAETSLSTQLSTAQLINGIILGIFSCFALTMPIFAVVMHIVHERVSGNKQLQTVCGMYTSVYWMANVVWDMFMYTVSVLLMVAFMAALPATFDTDLSVFFILAIMFGIGMILFAYVCSFIFDTARSALLLIGIGSYFLSVVALLLTFYTTETWYTRLDTFLTLFPPYFLTASLVTVTFQSFLPVSLQQATFSAAVLGDKMIESGAFAAKMLLIIVLHESDLAPISRVFRFIQHLLTKGTMDELLAKDKAVSDSDVLKEETKILSGVDEKNDLVLTVRNVGKFYSRDKKLAVKGVTFGVHKAECFGLLGVNGAGKSTLFQMLCGVHAPTFGDARVLGRSVFGAGGRGRHMSYCPQTDVLFEQLSAREHLLHYARVRGVPWGERCDVVDLLLIGVGLSSQNVRKATGSLSGGNKRKVQLAIALLDSPAVILLDEMTTGMDPRARRLAWRALARARTHAGCATVITSHSMEECEQLCDRLVIMVDGRFKCLGGVQYLKDKYGKNYNVKMRLSLDCDSAKLINTMLGRFSGSIVTEQHVAYLQMQIPVQALLLSTLFDSIHTLKIDFDIIEFSVSQTTLEHIFVDMVKEQDWDGGN